MSVLVGRQAPDFKAMALMPDKSFQEISLSDYKGKYVLLFFYPLDFTFVCPTELHAMQDQLAEFEKRGVQVLGISVDSHFTHLAWVNQPKHQGGIAGLCRQQEGQTGQTFYDDCCPEHRPCGKHRGKNKKRRF